MFPLVNKTFVFPYLDENMIWLRQTNKPAQIHCLTPFLLEAIMKYEEIYFDVEKCTVASEKILQIYTQQPELFETVYRDHLWCPSCKRVQVAVVVAGGIYLRGYRTQMHAEGCDHIQPVYIPRNLDELKESPEDIRKIQHQIDTLLRRTYAQQIESTRRNKNRSPMCSTNTSSLCLQGKIRLGYRLSQKRIDTMLGEDDFESPKVFYGLVRTHWNPKKRFLWLYIPGARTRICGLYITNMVESYLQKSGVLLHDYPLAHIAFLGQLEKFPDGTPKCILEDSRFLQLEESLSQ